ncbi:eae-like protein, partial [Escherichia coli]|nr:eae-like protein [Escherichia coli]
LHNSKTLAPYALLAELRAQGVEMVREHPSIKLCSLTHICDELAAELRRGGNQ